MATTASSRVDVTHDHGVAGERVLRVLDLFAGAGGLTAGMHAASARFRTVRAVELEPEAAATYQANYGDVVYCGPIQTWLEQEEVPEVDVVVGGPPCQGFSTLGKRDVDDERNLLWRYYAETVRRARPQYFVMENVPAFLKSPQFSVFTEAFAPGGALEEYEFEARVLNAADYGAAQVRKRVVVLGRHRDASAVVMPNATHTPEMYRTVRDAFEGDGRQAVPRHAAEFELPPGTVDRFGRTMPGVFKASDLHVGRSYTDLSLERFRAIPYGGGRFDLPDELKAPCWRKHRTGSGDVMGRLVWEKPSVTIRTEFFKPEKGRYLHPTQHRAITHFEAARIQGFDDDYKFVGSRTAIARQIGNAVPIPLGKALGREILTALDA